MTLPLRLLPRSSCLLLCLLPGVWGCGGGQDASDENWWGVVAPRIANDSRRIHLESGVYTAHIGAMSGRFRSEGVVLAGREGAGLHLRLGGWRDGGGALAAFAREPRLGGCAPGPQLDPAGACLPRLEYAHGGLTEWWSSTANGYEQGFEIAASEGDSIALWVRTPAEVSGSGDSLQLTDPSGRSWRVSDLRAWDADGRRLPARMLGVEGGFELQVTTVGARFPITVDPLYAPEDTRLVGGDAAGDHLGTSVATGGDLNGDGYNDVVVGATGSDASSANGGAFYVYYSSAGGLENTAYSTTHALGAGAEVGAALAIDGDIEGDGYDDVLVGAPGFYGDIGAVLSCSGGASGITGCSNSYVGGTGMRMGSAVAYVPDVDGDGDDELAFGGPAYASDGGYVGTLLGSPSGWGSLTSIFGTGGEALGAALTGGDFNGDGAGDLAIGLTGTDTVWLLEGSAAGIAASASRAFTGTSGDGFGASLAAVDLDADGDDELVVGAVSATNVNGGFSIFEGQASLPSTGATFVLAGSTGAELGYALASTPDLDGDGLPELAVGEPGGTTGRVLVYDGAPGSLALLTTLTGSEAGARYGAALGGTGDLDGDGDSELLVGAPESSLTASEAGAAYLVEGASATAMEAGVVSDTMEGDLAAGRFGIKLAAAGDLDNDGFDDLAVGAPAHSGAGALAGAAYVFHGSETGLSTTAGATMYGEAAGDALGSSLASAGDVNGDGYDALLVAAPTHDTAGSNAGRVYLYEGSASGVSAVTTTLDGEAAGEQFGLGLAGGKQVYRAGYDDVAIGAPYATTSSGGGASGEVRIFRGSATGLATTVTARLPGLAANDYLGSTIAFVDSSHDNYADIAAGAANAAGSGSDAGEVSIFYGVEGGVSTTPDLTLSGSTPSGRFGYAVASAGDVDGDGYEELLVGAPNEGAGAGSAYLYAGSSTGLVATSVWTLSGGAASDYAGISVAAGDFDGDGWSEPVVGAFADDSAAVDAGAVTISTLDASFSLEITEELRGEAVADYFGYAAATGDYNGDAVDDLAVGAFGADGGGSESGSVYVYYGTVGDADADGVRSDEDCDEGDAGIGAPTTAWYADADGDTFGDASAEKYACVEPFGHVADSTDCNDGVSEIYPGAAELCDDADTDEDCNGLADDDDTSAVGVSTWFPDGDEDGYGDEDAPIEACDVPPGYQTVGDDCDDADATVNPDGVELCATDADDDCDGLPAVVDASTADLLAFYNDNDDDGYGGSFEEYACEVSPGVVENDDDCDDGSAAVSPAATEICDALDVDEDCDGLADDADSGVVGDAWYADADGDGYGDAGSGVSSCEQPTNYVDNLLDCDDAAAAVNPAAVEVCDALDIDEDCSGGSEDEDSAASGKTAWYRDEDGDGYGDPALSIDACDLPSGYAASADDCDDGESAYHPGADEADCTDPADYNCDGSTGYADVDADGWAACSECNDADASVFPGAPDAVGDEVDGDCDGAVVCWADADADGFHDGAAVIVSADADCGDVGEALDAAGGDCDDANAALYPGAVEEDCADPVDYNCDGSTGYADGDADGWAACADCDDGDAAVSPEATERCNDRDDDCDGEIDGAGALEATTFAADADGDGYTNPEVVATACDAPEGYAVPSATADCDDGDASAYPGAPEAADDGIDQDCDGEDLEGDIAVGDTAGDPPGADTGGVNASAGACGCATGSPFAAIPMAVGALLASRRRQRGGRA